MVAALFVHGAAMRPLPLASVRGGQVVMGAPTDAMMKSIRKLTDALQREVEANALGHLSLGVEEREETGPGSELLKVLSEAEDTHRENVRRLHERFPALAEADRLLSPSRHKERMSQLKVTHAKNVRRLHERFPALAAVDRSNSERLRKLVQAFPSLSSGTLDADELRQAS